MIGSEPGGFRSGRGALDKQDVVDGFGDGVEVADNGDEFVAAAFGAQNVEGGVESGGVEGAESFVEEEGVEAGSVAAVEFNKG